MNNELMLALYDSHKRLMRLCETFEQDKDYAKLAYATAAKNQLHIAIEYAGQIDEA